jgi:AraC-like DNA-binding protein
MLALPLGGQPRLVLLHGAIAASTFPTGYTGSHHNAFWVLNLLDGEAEVELSGRTWAVAAGWAVLTPPGVDHVWRTPQRVGFIHAHFRASGDPVGVPVAQDLGARAGELRALLMDAARRVSAEPERATIALWHLLWQLSATPLRPAAPVHHPVMRGLLDVLAAGGSAEPAHLARRLGVTQRHLNRLCVAAFGLPLAAWLRRNRLQRARQLLAETTWPVARIAAETGFSDLQHFNKAMRAFAGRSPRELR